MEDRIINIPTDNCDENYCSFSAKGCCNKLNVYDMLKYDTIVVTKGAVEAIEEVYA